MNSEDAVILTDGAALLNECGWSVGPGTFERI